MSPWQLDKNVPLGRVAVNASVGFEADGIKWEAFHDPKDGKVKLDGEKVIEFPKLPVFQRLTLKVTRWEEKGQRFMIEDAEMVP